MKEALIKGKEQKEQKEGKEARSFLGFFLNLFFTLCHPLHSRYNKITK